MASAALELLIQLKDEASGPLSAITGSLGGMGKAALTVAGGGLLAIGGGLTAAIAVERIALFPVGAAITSFDRGLVIGWLTAQPEVVFVHIDRRSNGDHAPFEHTGRLHGQDA